MSSSTIGVVLVLTLAPAGGAGEPPRVYIDAPHIEVEARLCGRSDHFLGVPDGDTLDVVLTRILDPQHGEARCTSCWARQTRSRTVHGDTQIRLGGGIDAPEGDAPGGPETREILLRLLREAETLHLDVDDGARGCDEHGHSGRDTHCRLLAKVYVRDGERYVDVNATLVAWGREHYPRHDWLRYAGLPSEFAGRGKPPGPTPSPADDPTVWVTRSGKRFHKDGCDALARSRFPVARSAALARGFTPCRACEP